MILKYIKYTLVKYFPASFLDYVTFFLFNLIFSLAFITNIPFLSQIVFNTYNTSYVLFVPKEKENFEEKKDLIFSDLSLNTNIISVSEVQKKEILKKLRTKISLRKSEEELVPEVFEITVKKGKYLQLEEENNKLNKVIQGTKIIEKRKGLQDFNAKNYFFLFASIFLFILILAVLHADHARKINKYLEKSRLFGVKDKNIIYNVVKGYSLFHFLGIFAGYAIVYILEGFYSINPVIASDFLVFIIIFLLIQNLVVFFNLVLILKSSLRKFL